MGYRLQNYLNKYKKGTSYFITDFDFPTGYENLKAIYYTVGEHKVFAFIGLPTIKKPKNGFPAIVLVHGGDGCAYYEWVKKWTEKGYVAIAPDFNSNYATSSNRREQNFLGGPKGYGSFSQMNNEHPWTFFSVNSIFSATEVLLMQKDVDAQKLALCGLSWGGVLSLIALSVEKRFKAAAIIYSSGYILESEFFDDAITLANMNEQDKKVYSEFFDPKSYVREISVPIFFLAGADDVAFTMQGRKKTFEKIKVEKRFSYRKKLPHGHSAGWSCEEVYNFISRKINDEEYPTIDVKIEEKQVVIPAFGSYQQVELVYTDKFFNKVKREWESCDITSSVMVLPKQCKYFFVSAKDEKGMIYSSDVYQI